MIFRYSEALATGACQKAIMDEVMKRPGISCRVGRYGFFSYREPAG